VVKIKGLHADRSLSSELENFCSLHLDPAVSPKYPNLIQNYTVSFVGNGRHNFKLKVHFRKQHFIPIGNAKIDAIELKLSKKQE
jgi:hypothetical protein